MTTDYLSEMKGIIIREGWRRVVMDDDRALDGDRKVFLRGEGSGDVL